MWESIWNTIFGPPPKSRGSQVEYKPNIPVPTIPKVTVYKYKSVIQFKREDGTDVEIVLETDEHISGNKGKPTGTRTGGPF